MPFEGKETLISELYGYRFSKECLRPLLRRIVSIIIWIRMCTRIGSALVIFIQKAISIFDDIKNNGVIIFLFKFNILNTGMLIFEKATEKHRCKKGLNHQPLCFIIYV